jgi:hypothetical protein
MSRLSLGRAVLDYASIHWFHGDNGRVKASYSDPEDKTNSPLSDLGFQVESKGEGDDQRNVVSGRTPGGLVFEMTSGWDSSQGVVKVGSAEHIAELQGVTLEQLLKRASDEREAQIAIWEKHELTKEMANVAKRVYFPNGKPVAIVAIGNECFRRSLGIMGAIYRRSLPPLSAPLSYDVDVLVKEWPDETARIADHLLENTRKDQGRVKLSTLDLLNTAVMFHRASPAKFKERTLMDANVKRGTAQKLHSYVVLANRHRAVKLVERAFKPIPQGGIVVYNEECPIPIESVKAEHCRNMLNNRNPFDKERKERITNPKIHAYLEKVITGSGDVGPVPMKMNEFRAYKDSPVDLVRYIVAAVATGNEEMLKVLDDMSEEINAATAELIPEYDDTGAAVDSEVDADEVDAETEEVASE